MLIYFDNATLLGWFRIAVHRLYTHTFIIHDNLWVPARAAESVKRRLRVQKVGSSIPNRGNPITCVVCIKQTDIAIIIILI